MEKAVHEFKSFKEADDFEKEYWLNASVSEKFEAVEVIRANYNGLFHSDLKGIEKVVKKRKLHDKEQD
jgi:hypothetical protein